MALLKKNPFVAENNKPFYTLGLSKTVLIVGLGNMGEKYAKTRHNVGFEALDGFLGAHSEQNWSQKKDLKCLMAQVDIANTRVILCKPTTMMNLSGEAVQAVAGFYKIPVSEIVVVYDELAINFGQIRCRAGGSAAGHNGVKSVIQHIGEDFERVRIGIGPKKPEQMDSADFVLATFSKEEQEQMKPLKREVTAILTERIATGKLPHDTINFLV